MCPHLICLLLHMDFAIQNARNTTNYPFKHSLLAVLNHAGSRVSAYHDFHAFYF